MIARSIIGVTLHNERGLQRIKIRFDKLIELHLAPFQDPLAGVCELALNARTLDSFVALVMGIAATVTRLHHRLLHRHAFRKIDCRGLLPVDIVIGPPGR